MTPTPADSPVYSIFAEDPDFRGLLDRFVKSLNKQRQNLLSVYANRQWSELRRIAHQMKGAGGGYGFPGLSERAEAVEICSQNRDESETSRSVEDLCTYIDRIHV